MRPHILIWLRFRLSVSKPLPLLTPPCNGPPSDDAKEWQNVFDPIYAMASIEKLYHMTWGRMVADPEEVLLIIGMATLLCKNIFLPKKAWAPSEERADAFKSSPEFHALLRAVGFHDGANSTISTVFSTLDPGRLEGHISIHTLSFDYPAPDKRHEIEDRTRFGGMRIHLLLSKEQVVRCPLRGNIRGWVKEPSDADGRRLQDAILIHFWRDATAVQEVDDWDTFSLTRWKAELDRIGPVAIREEHCDLVSVYAEED